MANSLDGIGPTLKTLRKKAGLSSKEVAQRLGKSESTVLNQETPAARLSGRTIGEYLGALGASLRDLADEHEGQNESKQHEALVDGLVARLASMRTDKDRELEAAKRRIEQLEEQLGERSEEGGSAPAPSAAEFTLLGEFVDNLLSFYADDAEGRSVVYRILAGRTWLSRQDMRASEIEKLMAEKRREGIDRTDPERVD